MKNNEITERPQAICNSGDPEADDIDDEDNITIRSTRARKVKFREWLDL